jgi:hypothetical protein
MFNKLFSNVIRVLTVFCLVQTAFISKIYANLNPCEAALTLEQKIETLKPYGPRGFVVANVAKNPVEMAYNLDAGLGAGYFQWLQSTYIINAAKVKERLKKDKEMGIDRKEQFFGEFEVRRKIEIQITENSGRKTPATAPFILVSDLSQDDLKRIFEDSKKMNPTEDSTRIFKDELEVSKLYAARFVEGDSFVIEEVPKDVKDRFEEIHVFMNKPESEEGENGYFFMQSSWNDGAHGAIQFKDWADSGTIKNMRKLRKKLLKLGFQIVFNQSRLDEFNFVMSRCALMPRKDGPNFNSRFSDDDLAKWRELFSRGKAYSVSIKNPSGEIVAGSFGYVNQEKGIVQGDSVFYPASFRVDVYDSLDESSRNLLETQKLTWSNQEFKYTQGEFMALKSFYDTSKTNNRFPEIVFEGGQIDLARVAIGSLGERALLAGVKFMDAGLVTEFTDSMRGKFLSNLEWKALVSEAHKNGANQLNLNTSYSSNEEEVSTIIIETLFLLENLPPLRDYMSENLVKIDELLSSDVLDEYEKKEVKAVATQTRSLLKKTENFESNLEIKRELILDYYKQLKSFRDKIETLFKVLQKD